MIDDGILSLINRGAGQRRPEAVLARCEAFFRYEHSLQLALPLLVDALRPYIAPDALFVGRLGAQGSLSEAAFWTESSALPLAALQKAFAPESGALWTRHLHDGALVHGDSLAALLPGQPAAGEARPLLFCIRHNGVPQGLFFCNKPGFCGDWTEDEQSLISVLGGVMGVFFAGKTHCDVQEFHNNVLNAAMDQVKIGMYITNPETDEILYMNRAMKDFFKVSDPEGQTCWKILQAGKEERCEFCPVSYLKEHPNERVVYRWEEQNTLLNRVYENYDSLMRWTDGSLVHLQQSVDITDVKRLSRDAFIDDLTGLMNRRAGRVRLAQALEDTRKGDGTLTAMLADVNALKAINDHFGHQEGDRVLCLVAQALRGGVREPGFCFRLGGDEFVAVFFMDKHGAAQCMDDILRQLRQGAGELGLPYRPDFCFGGFEVGPGHDLSLAEVLAKADENMYDWKKQCHIRAAELRLGAGAQADAKQAAFRYDASRLYDALAASTDSYIYVSNMETGTFRYSRAMMEEFGLPGEIVENAAAVWGERVHPDDRAAFMEANQIIADGRADSHCVEYRAKNRNGDWVWVRCRGHLERATNGEPVLFAGFITNLGQNNDIDHVTGLFNKVKLAMDVTSALENRPDYPMQLLVFGVDGFKRINELHGRSFGDAVLRIIAHKMLETLPVNAAAYRLDGDEFAVLLHGEREEASAIYRSLAETFRRQREYNGKKYFCTLSAGIAGYPDEGGSWQGLLQNAGYALAASKKSGRNRLSFFQTELVSNQKRTLELSELLRESVEHHFEGFSLVYQPQVSADGKKLLGAEALARWSCEPYGTVSPAEFIPLLEQSGLIVDFGRWVFQQAAAQCKAWTALQADFAVSVNLSYLQVVSDDVALYVSHLLEKFALSPENLIVEITESNMIQENSRISQIFAEIRALGVRIAMDDFGTGYSSLGLLKSLPADVVKIDRTFVQDILHSSFDATFIRFMVALCHDVGIKVCLEGVERWEEQNLVRPMGIDSIQGYLFGRPVDAESFMQHFSGKGLEA